MTPPEIRGVREWGSTSYDLPIFVIFGSKKGCFLAIFWSKMDPFFDPFFTVFGGTPGFGLDLHSDFGGSEKRGQKPVPCFEKNWAKTGVLFWGVPDPGIVENHTRFCHFWSKKWSKNRSFFGQKVESGGQK